MFERQGEITPPWGEPSVAWRRRPSSRTPAFSHLSIIRRITPSETCMAAQQLGYAPAWALGSVGAISFFPIIDGVKQLTILGEQGAASARDAKTIGDTTKLDSKRRAFVRASGKLQDLKIIGVWKDRVWAAGQTGQVRT
jgi:hypothetical protein